ncbi:MAG: EamA family transporter [Moraxellaceae bacterium]|nr:MAG: EamA family transporter [Moraxellaceae bacterium]
MSTAIAYIIVILVWSTTPLGIKWSSEGFAPLAGAFWRVFIAAGVAMLLAKLMRVVVPLHKKALYSYAAANIGIFLGLGATYVGAAYLPSGMVSVVFGLSPIISSVLARYILNEPPFGIVQWIALMFALSGLLVVFQGDIRTGQDSSIGLVLILFGVGCFCISGVLIKKIDASLHPAAQTSGSLMLAMPLFGVAYYFTGESVENVTEKSAMAIVYLALFGSVIGFFCYFYVLERMPASSVALTTLITPVLAISLGVFLNGEVLSISIIVGAMLICCGLCVYYWGGRLVGAVDEK